MGDFGVIFDMIKQSENLQERGIICSGDTVCTFDNDIIFVHTPKGLGGGVTIRLPDDYKNNLFKNKASRIVLVAEPMSRLIVTDDGSGDFVEIFVEEEAEITYLSVHNKVIHSHIKKSAVIQKNGKINWIEAYYGGDSINNTCNILLQGDGAAATNTNLFFCDKTKKYNISIQTTQEGNATDAKINIFGVVCDNAYSMCHGIMNVARGSSNSLAHQRIKVLLIGKDAHAEAIPAMQIHNFNTSARHESSIGQISKEKLFYLMSRGLNEQEAKKKIVEGFLTYFIKDIESEKDREQISTMMYDRLWAK